jgi:hypothetical protein
MNSKASHAAPVTWSLSLLAAPVLYLLSIPPLMVLSCGWSRDTFIDWTGGGAHYNEVWVYKKAPPRWLQIYARPGRWLKQADPFKGPLEAYEKWVQELAK